MTPIEVINITSYLLLTVTLLASLYRVLRYSRWWINSAGRSVVIFQICLAALVIYAGASLIWPYDWRNWVRPVVLGGIWLASLNQLYVIVKSQGGWRRRNRPRGDRGRREADAAL